MSLRSETATLRSFVASHDDLPAFRAGFFVLSLLSAALLNFGAFGLLIVAHMGLDVVKYREVHRFRWGMTFRGTVRESLPDMTLLVLGLVVSILLDPSLHLVSAIALHSHTAVIRGGAIVLSKLVVLGRFAVVLAHPEEHLQSTAIARRREWRFGEVSFAVLFLVLIAVLLAAPSILEFSDAVYHEVVRRAVLPWHV